MDSLQVICTLLYVLDLALLMTYVVYVFRKYGYIISLFNIGLFQFYATILISPIYFFSDESWTSLSIESAELMRPFLLQSMLINYGGTAIFMIVLLVCVWRLGERWSTGALSRRIAEGIDSRVAAVLVVLAAAAFTYLCYRYNGMFPLFNKGRAFYLNKPFSPIYLLVCEMLSLLGLYEGLRFVVRRKGLAWFLLCDACLFLTGNRGTVLLQVILPVVLYGIYVHGLKKDGVRGLKRQTWTVLVVLVITAAGGLALQTIRGGKGVGGIQAYANEIAYGNTFCDVRDGAYLLKGHHELLNDELVYGKTYAAGLISFVPSSMSSFRAEWSWGRFSSQKLSHWKNHFGFRGGNFLEAYLNFGVVGVVVSAVLMALILAWQEQLFRDVFLRGYESVTGKEILVCSLLGQLSSFISCSSGAYNGYATVGIIVVLWVSSKVLWLVSPRRDG